MIVSERRLRRPPDVPSDRIHAHSCGRLKDKGRMNLSQRNATWAPSGDATPHELDPACAPGTQAASRGSSQASQTSSIPKCVTHFIPKSLSGSIAVASSRAQDTVLAYSTAPHNATAPALFSNRIIACPTKW